MTATERRVFQAETRRLKSRCGVLAALLVAGGVTAWAAGNVRIKGTVKTSSGEPLAGASVILVPVNASGEPSGGASTQVETNKKGRFTFGFAKPGSYALEVGGDAYRIVHVAVKLRGAERKPVYGPQGRIDDVDTDVAPTRQIRLDIPPDAFYVDADLTVEAAPAPAAAAGAAAPSMEALKEKNLGEEVKQILDDLQGGDAGAALQELDRLLDKNPDLAPLHYLRGFALVKLHRIPEAEQALRRAIELDPAIQGASGLLGQVLAEEGRYEEAAEALRHELELTEDPAQRAPLLLSLGQVLLEMKRNEEAVEALEEAYELAPDLPQVRVHLANAYTAAGRVEDASRLIEEDAGMDPHSAAVLHYNLATSLFRREQWEEAARHYRRALELDPSLAEAHKYLGHTYNSMERFADAVREFEAYLDAAPDAPDREEIELIVAALRKVVEAQARQNP